MAYATDTRSVSVPFLARVRAAFEGFADALAKRDAYQRIVLELGELSDRDLSDLGIQRSEIHSIAIRRAFGN